MACETIQRRLLTEENLTLENPTVSLISEETWKQVFPMLPLNSSRVKLNIYSGQGLCVLGKGIVQVEYGNQKAKLLLIVAKGNGASLFGRNWLESIQIDWGSIKQVSYQLDQVLSEHQGVVQEGLGTLEDIQISLTVKPGSKAKFFQPRPVLYALKGVIKRELECLEQQGIIEPVKYSDWAAPVVPVPKADGSIRLCGNYKVTNNPKILVNQFPVPTPEDLFSTLAGGKAFTKLDLSRAYHQVILEPASCKYLIISTHKGLYQYTRLPFGVASAPSHFSENDGKLVTGYIRGGGVS